MTEQELFWAGEFGDEYNCRNTGGEFLPPRLAMFSRIMARTEGVRTILELGCNTGTNLVALQMLGYPDVRGVEVNAYAAKEAQSAGLRVVHGSLLETEGEPSDMVMTVGVLIHIHPDELPVAYDRLVTPARRYVLIVEYYDPNPVDILYRGHTGRLWKRDFAGELLDRYPLRLVDYGFVYHRDEFPQDDVTWFLMEVK